MNLFKKANIPNVKDQLTRFKQPAGSEGWDVVQLITDSMRLFAAIGLLLLPLTKYLPQVLLVQAVFTGIKILCYLFEKEKSDKEAVWYSFELAAVVIAFVLVPELMPVILFGTAAVGLLYHIYLWKVFES